MDSRLDVFAALGLGDGEAHVLRNAGGVVTDDVIRSLAISQRRLGTREVMLIHHTDCGMEKVTDDGFRAELQEATGVAPGVRDRVLHRRRGRRAPVDPARPPLALHPPPRRRARLRLRRRHPPPARDRGRGEMGERPTAPGARRSTPRPSPAPGGGWRRRRSPPTAPSGGRRGGRPRAGAAALMRRPAGGEPEEVTPAGGQRAHPRPRVRRRRLDAGRAPTSSSSSTSPTSASTASGSARSRSRSRRSRTSPPALRYADMRLTPGRRAPSSACARSTARAKRRTRSSRCRSTAPASRRVLASGRDFYSFPRLSPDGSRLAWTCWDHPNMPWDGTELWVAPLARPGARRRLRRRRPGRVGLPARVGRARAACTSSPTATAGGTSTATEGEETVAADRRGGRPRPPAVALRRLHLRLPRRRRDRLRPLRARRGTALPARARRRARPRPRASPTPPSASPRSRRRGTERRLRRRQPGARDRGRRPRRRQRRAGGGARSASERAGRRRPTSRSRARSSSRPASGETAHGFYYPPTNPDFEAPAGELPPLIVAEPRRPDLARDPGARPRVPLLDQPRLRRRRRQLPRLAAATAAPTATRLRGTWGIVDTDDCIAAARHLAASGEADGERLAIRGGSAGGYATLCALVFHDEFAAGASYYGVADAETLATDTHKFESRYLDGLIGPYPERADLYRERSPIHFVERLRAPVILFQGLEDEVVPPEPGGDDGRGADARTASPTPTSPSRASSTASAARRPRSAASKPSSTSTAASSASSRPTSWSRSRSTVRRSPLTGSRDDGARDYAAPDRARPGWSRR